MREGEYFAAGTADAVERERLAALESAFDSKSTQQLRRLGVTNGWKCLDVGAGGGSITRWLAEQVGDDGHVVAADIDTRFLRDIRRPNVEVREFNILDNGFEDGQFDLVHCRFLLIHLSDPQLAIKRMLRAAKIGGWVMVEEFDFSSLRAVQSEEPASAFFTSKIRDTFRNVGQAKLFDPYLGSRTRDLLENAGAPEVHCEGTVLLRRGGDAEAVLHRRSLPTLCDGGACSRADSQKMQKILMDPDFRFIGSTVFAAWGRRAG
jgi:SAM-dependent methyltransferase